MAFFGPKTICTYINIHVWHFLYKFIIVFFAMCMGLFVFMTCEQNTPFLGGTNIYIDLEFWNIETLFHRLVVAEPLQNYPIFGHKFHFGFFETGLNLKNSKKWNLIKPDQIWSNSRFWSDLIRFDQISFFWFFGPNFDSNAIQLEIECEKNGFRCFCHGKPLEKGLLCSNKQMFHVYIFWL